jgi:hypothetical protein
MSRKWEVLLYSLAGCILVFIVLLVTLTLEPRTPLPTTQVQQWCISTNQAFACDLRNFSHQNGDETIVQYTAPYDSYCMTMDIPRGYIFKDTELGKEVAYGIGGNFMLSTCGGNISEYKAATTFEKIQFAIGEVYHHIKSKFLSWYYQQRFQLRTSRHIRMPAFSIYYPASQS